MKPSMLTAAAAAMLAAAIAPAQAQIRVTEVAPWSSGNSSFESDWFELTNFGPSAVDITGWKVDDNSNVFANARDLRGVTSIAAGQSLIFIESNADGSNAAAKVAGFISSWFGTTPPAGLVVGNYGGAGIGLSTDPGDSVNIFDAGGALRARVSFGLSPGAAPFPSFDNAAGINGATVADAATISLLSAVGVNGAFSANDGHAFGSPSLVPEPQTYALLLAGLAVIGYAVRRRRAPPA